MFRAINQSFRRNVFVRAISPLWAGEQLSLLRKRMLTLLKAPDKISLKFTNGFGEVSGKEEVYTPIINQIARGPVKIADLYKALPGIILTGVEKRLRGLNKSLIIPINQAAAFINALGNSLKELNEQLTRQQEEQENKNETLQ